MAPRRTLYKSPQQSTTPTKARSPPLHHHDPNNQRHTPITKSPQTTMAPRRTPFQITPTINDTNLGTIAALAQLVHPIVLKARAKKKASAMSHGIGSPKAENTAPNVSVLVSTEALRSTGRRRREK